MLNLEVAYMSKDRLTMLAAMEEANFWHNRTTIFPLHPGLCEVIRGYSPTRN
jgi:hypothetical protein